MNHRIKLMELDRCTNSQLLSSLAMIKLKSELTFRRKVRNLLAVHYVGVVYV